MAEESTRREKADVEEVKLNHEENQEKPIILENISFSASFNPKTGDRIYKSSAPGRKLVELSKNSALPALNISYKVKVIEDTNPNNKDKGKFIVELYYESPDQKASEIVNVISEKQKTATTEEDWQEVAKLFEELKAVYEPVTADIVEDVEKNSLFEQYENQVNMMIRLGIMNICESGAFGIQGIDGKEYPGPTFQEIAHKIESMREFIKEKQKQGFIRLLLVPFGKSLEDLVDVYGKLLLEKQKQGKLFTAKKDANNPNEKFDPLKIHWHEPVRVADELRNADVNGNLVYWPKEFSKNHQGKTKGEILEEGNDMQGWNVIFVEENPNIPEADQAEAIGGRTRIDAKGTTIKEYIESVGGFPIPKNYLKAINERSQDFRSFYYGESGMTPEDQLMYAITYLEEHDQVIDDWRGNGKNSYQIGAYLHNSSMVPIASLHQYDDGNNVSMIDGAYIGLEDAMAGVRTSVRIQ